MTCNQPDRVLNICPPASPAISMPVSVLVNPLCRVIGILFVFFKELPRNVSGCFGVSFGVSFGVGFRVGFRVASALLSYNFRPSFGFSFRSVSIPVSTLLPTVGALVSDLLPLQSLLCSPPFSALFFNLLSAFFVHLICI